MAIDPLHEDLITLDEAKDFFPRSPSGKRPHVSRLYRYTVEGCRGVVLDWIQCGARRCTSKQAIARFFAALTAAVADRRTTANEKVETTLPVTFSI